MRIIYFSMALLVFSFVVVPMYSGISKKHDEIITTSVDTVAAADSSLSFEEIYEIAGESNTEDPAFLNTIQPAAGSVNANQEFSTGFRAVEDSALADTPTDSFLEETNQNAVDEENAL